jgi:hypothetical protein
LYTGNQYQLRPGPLLGSHPIWAIDHWPCQLLYRHGATTTVAYDKPTPNYVQIANKISIWLDTPLLSGGGLYVYEWHCWQAGWCYYCTHNVARRPKVTKVASPTPNYIHGRSASTDTKVSVYKICHESEKGSEGVDWIHLTEDSPVVDSSGIRQWSCGFQKRRGISRPSDHKLIRNDCST